MNVRSLVALVLVALLLGAADGAAAPVASPYAEELVRAASARHLAREVGWLRLGHYRSGVFGGSGSEVDGSKFFLSAGGKDDPEAELAATLRAFFAPAPPGPPPSGPLTPEAVAREHAICRFPARFMWLDSELHFTRSELPRVGCRGFVEFVSILRPETITLVFSSYYLNNPSSAFGHTFLRVNKAGRRGAEHNDLLDYGIDYAARVDTTNSLLYAFKGLTGLFPGTFSKVPYYLKVREYNDFESRDLWEYELDLRPEEVRMFVAHLWELGSTYFRYFYLSENCSYHILDALEAASPRLHLLEQLTWPVLPADTIKALYRNPGLVRDVQYRPSAETVFRRRLRDLSSEETHALANLVGDPDAPLPASFSVTQRVLVLDAALDLADSVFARELLKSEAERDVEVGDYKQRLLERRAAEGVPSDPLVYPPPESRMPHRGHDSRRFGMGSGFSTSDRFYHTLKLRLALHDFGDPAQGFPETAQVEFLPTTLRYDVESPRLSLEDFSLVTLLSLSPWDRFRKALAWSASIGASRIRDGGCADCLAARAQVSGGGTVSFLADGVLAYLLVRNEIDALAPIDGIAHLPLRAGIGPSAGVRIRLDDDVVATAQGFWLYLPAQAVWQTWSAEASVRWQYLRNFALGLEGRMQPDASSAHAISYLYF